MKKYFLLVFILVFYSSLFGLDNDYFKKNKNIDILYVNSPEGLRVRDNASLNSKKIETLYDRMVVKVISIGDEAVIAFLEDQDHLFIGTIDQYISFYSEERKENSFIQESLNNMKDHRKR